MGTPSDMTQLSFLRSAALVVAAALILAFPQTARAATTWTFYGITVHVSTNNVNVQNPRTKQSMSFLLVPKFDSVFSADGKTTYQMGKVKPGQYVGVVYDRKALGVAHADKIYLLNNANEKIGAQ